MATINTYATLAEYKAYATARAQTMATDATDDGVIEDLLESASRYFDRETRRKFYPRIETRYYSVPRDQNNLRRLWLDDDLQAIAAAGITNGDATALAASEYYLEPRNASPKFAIVIKRSSNYRWEPDSDNNWEGVITVPGTWGYHDQYTQRAWAAGGTLNGALNNSALTFNATAGHSLAAGRIIRVDSELLIVSAVATNAITVVKRGDNGSTAAAHDDLSAVTIWTPMDDVRQAIYEITRNAYSRRYGGNESGQSRVTLAGVEIGPEDVSKTVRETMIGLTRRL